MKPLQDILIIDLSQYLAGPSASLKLADLGARVIKIERPHSGDPYRNVFFANSKISKYSTAFCATNRNKESYVANLKNKKDKDKVLKLISKADVLIHNFRPGVMDRLGLDYQLVKTTNPKLIYAEISGYGTKGPWKNKPGQDLLVQAVSGITMLSGNADKGPVALGIAMADLLAGGHLVQGILAALIQRERTNIGCKVSVNMLESILDLQFETTTTFYHDGGEPTQRTAKNNAHAYLGAPYGVYKTSNGYLALAMGSIPILGKLLNNEKLQSFTDPASWFNKRDEIKEIIASQLKTDTTEKWLSILEPADVWCADVLDWERLLAHDGFKSLDMLQEVCNSEGIKYQTTRCPIKIDGKTLKSPIGAPPLGDHSTLPDETEQ